MDYKTDIPSFLSSLDAKESLAYMGLTAKIENSFRDAYAFYLYEKYGSELIVSREHKGGGVSRVDLALLDTKNGAIQNIIEFKACYSFDLLRPKDMEYIEKIKGDFEKHTMKPYDKEYILLSVRVNGTPDEKYKYIDKYDIIKKNIKRPSSAEHKSIAAQNIEQWTKQITEIKLKGSGSESLGKAFGVDVYLDYFIFSPSSLDQVTCAPLSRHRSDNR
ncbi:MAG: hypothetical protein WC838_02375 [Candidatus Margulisiibacteriota bacterium]